MCASREKKKVQNVSFHSLSQQENTNSKFTVNHQVFSLFFTRVKIFKPTKTFHFTTHVYCIGTAVIEFEFKLMHFFKILFFVFFLTSFF